MRTAVILGLVLTGCAPGAYTVGAVPAAVVAVLSPVRDAGQPVGSPPVARVIDAPDLDPSGRGRPWFPAEGPFWSSAPAAPSGPRCAPRPPDWLSPPPWRRGFGTDATIGCAPLL